MSIESSTKTISSQLVEKLLAGYEPVSPIIEKIGNIIKKHNRFLLTTHEDADPDGIGSEIGLFHLLESLGKECIIINNEAIPESLAFMDVDKKIKSIESEQFEDLADYFVFIVDSSEPERSKPVSDVFLKAGCEWASIDHHILPDNDHFNCDPTYAATAEIIFDLYTYFNKQPDINAATAIYTGLVADTGNFRYSKTSLRTHVAGGSLLAVGIDTDRIYRNIYESAPVDRLTLIGRVMSNIEIDKKLKYAAAAITLKMKKDLELGDAGTEGIVNMLLAAQGINIAILMKESDEGDLKCSLRSIDENDVASIARNFGGGGHKNAAGLKITGKKFDQAAKEVVDAVKKYLETRS